jgi:hypothetical protein
MNLIVAAEEIKSKRKNCAQEKISRHRGGKIHQHFWMFGS